MVNKVTLAGFSGDKQMQSPGNAYHGKVCPTFSLDAMNAKFFKLQNSTKQKTLSR